MGETDEHRDEMVRQIELLRRFFGPVRLRLGNLLVYYEQGNPKRFVVPDVFVVKDLEPRTATDLQAVGRAAAPDVVVEVTSRKTKKTDSITKPSVPPFGREGVLPVRSHAGLPGSAAARLSAGGRQIPADRRRCAGGWSASNWGCGCRQKVAS